MLKDVKQFFSDRETLKNGYWGGILSSNLNSLNHKYELVRIEKAKNRLDKNRLIMEHINTILFMERHKKQIQSFDIDNQTIAQELASLSEEQEKIQYDFDIIHKRPQMNKLARELKHHSQNIHQSSELGQKIKQTKWAEYFAKNSREASSSSPFHRAVQQIQLSETVENGYKCEELNEGLSSKIVWNRFKDSYMDKKLKESLQKNCPLSEMQIDEEFEGQWKQFIEAHDIK